MLDPHGKLAHVHPDLVRIMQQASQTPQAFQIVYGLRTAAEEEKAVATGHSQTRRSRHLMQKCGFACAVDVVALNADGTLNWAEGDEERVFGHIALEVKAAAKQLKIPLQWGGDPIGAWTPDVISHFRDWGHFQLPWKEYP